MKQMGPTLFDIEGKYGENFDKFRVDTRNNGWQKILLFVSSELLKCQQSYARNSAKVLANMSRTGELNMDDVNIIIDTLKTTGEKEFVKPEPVFSAIEILEAVRNSFGITGVFKK